MANIPAKQFSVTTPLNPEKPNYSGALIALGVLYFMMGLVTCLNDTLVPFFKNGFSLSYAESSLVQFYFFLTYGIVSIPAGKIVERIGYKRGMVMGFGVAASGALLFFPAAMIHQYILFLIALFIIAIGIVILQVAANPYVTILGPSQTASSRLNMVQGVGALGTTVAPLLGSYFILSNGGASHLSSEAVKYPYLGIAGLLVLIAVIVSTLPLPQIQFSELPGSPQTERKSIFSFRNLRFGIPAIFMYVGAEVSIGSFLANYIADTLSIKIEHANNYVAFYWGGMLVGRFLGSAILRVVKPQKVLGISAVLSILLVIVSINSTGYTAVWSMVSVGLCNSVMFAIIFSLSVAGLGNRTTQASSLLSTAIAGGAVVSFSQGIMKDNYSWFASFLIPVICYMYILFFATSGHKPKSTGRLTPVPFNSNHQNKYPATVSE